MKTLENIYQQNHIDTCAISVDGIDYRTPDEEIWDALTEYLHHYFNEGEWTFYEAVKEVMSMGLTQEEQVEAVRIVLLMHELGKRF